MTMHLTKQKELLNDMVSLVVKWYARDFKAVHVDTNSIQFNENIKVAQARDS